VCSFLSQAWIDPVSILIHQFLSSEVSISVCNANDVISEDLDA
jgi:hypothetical protein